MKRVSETTQFKDIAETEFSFQPITRVWFGLAELVPEKIRDDLAAVRRYLMDFSNKATIELVFTGEVTIRRGVPQLDEKSGHTMLPMQITHLEEYCYSKELDSTIALSMVPNGVNFGVTHQMAPNIEAPLDLRMVLTLQFTPLHGNLTEHGAVPMACHPKQVQAQANALPLNYGSTTFSQRDLDAIPVQGADGTLHGYVAYSVMNPLSQLGGVVAARKALEAPKLEARHAAFLYSVPRGFA